MKILLKLQPSFDGCIVVGFSSAGIASLVWGYDADTLKEQGVSGLLCVMSFAAALFVRTPSGVGAEQQANAEIAVVVPAEQEWHRRATDTQPMPYSDSYSLKRFKWRLTRFVTRIAHLSDPQTKVATL